MKTFPLYHTSFPKKIYAYICKLYYFNGYLYLKQTPHSYFYLNQFSLCLSACVFEKISLLVIEHSKENHRLIRCTLPLGYEECLSSARSHFLFVRKAHFLLHISFFKVHICSCLYMKSKQNNFLRIN